ncbi:TPA: Fe(3+) dicitrate ABC transporter ATP-binding protein FecE [Salmonella enterica]|uniref:Iron-dicitrate ABC transporter ATP-binding subunit n=1 Tax=Salmonella enterica I TaxID=59201 RepID=A0A315FSI1_SALET|nr:iron-dicitrate ABC transporter ATP-binding subunit [Salmonella enterica]EBP3691355.1 Fe(3+) dicitrate ABC transporter ATP-binding protein FecE [Salmonella enterica subsp. enterica]EDQ9945232.1 Fe(3+) dicitrate ABC transporter ATP-binding protein FecE [Salmonella enterica subsp. enterica serovar Gaminara]EAU2599746.1 iron-dicitrate ABC transporter ATP-binding subunit [Salmonella enterica]EAW9872755.1 Fe(3+) dicitrate ABC transporter ATP-binding protein FecE [Salmonella enterica]
MTLRTENLTVSYGTQPVLNNLALTIPAGKITALLGPNGCGKSTLLNCFSRLLSPQSGKVLLADRPLDSFSSRQLARRLALLPQHHLTPEGITVRELVSYGRSPWLSLWGRLSVEDNARVNVAMSQTQTHHLAERRLTELSGGQRQRAFLAMVLAQDTPVVLLDEPTTYLDINHQVELMHLMHELQTQGKTVVAVLHDLNQASRYCDHLVMLANGRVMAQGAPDEVMKPELLKTVFRHRGRNSSRAGIGQADVCSEVNDTSRKK